MFIEDIYDQVKDLKLCSSKHQFSSDLAGRSKRWMSTIVSQGLEPSTLTLLVLSQNIMSKASATHRRVVINSAKNIVITINHELAKRVLVKCNDNENSRN